MKTYRRSSDNLEVCYIQDLPLERAVETYGGEFAEVIQLPPPSKKELDRLAEIANKKNALAQSDYKILKKLEKLLPADDADVLERQGKRNRINELEAL